MFTRQLIEEIKNKLYLLGKKDSLFDLVKDVGNDAYFSIVVDGENKRITVQKFIDIVSDVIGESKIGLSQEFGDSMLEGVSLKTLTEALNAIYVVDEDSIKARSLYKTVILPPNLDENNRSVLTQEMIQTPNTKYIIKYNFDVLENITMPQNCILVIDGGYLFSSTGIKTITGVLNSYDDNITLLDMILFEEQCVDGDTIIFNNFKIVSDSAGGSLPAPPPPTPTPTPVISEKWETVLNTNLLDNGFFNDSTGWDINDAERVTITDGVCNINCGFVASGSVGTEHPGYVSLIVLLDPGIYIAACYVSIDSLEPYLNPVSASGYPNGFRYGAVDSQSGIRNIHTFIQADGLGLSVREVLTGNKHYRDIDFPYVAICHVMDKVPILKIFVVRETVDVELKFGCIYGHQGTVTGKIYHAGLYRYTTEYPNQEFPTAAYNFPSQSIPNDFPFGQNLRYSDCYTNYKNYIENNKGFVSNTYGVKYPDSECKQAFIDTMNKMANEISLESSVFASPLGSGSKGDCPDWYINYITPSIEETVENKGYTDTGSTWNNTSVNSYVYRDINPSVIYFADNIHLDIETTSSNPTITYWKDGKFLQACQTSYATKGKFERGSDYDVLIKVPESCNKIIITTMQTSSIPTLKYASDIQRDNSSEYIHAAYHADKYPPKSTYTTAKDLCIFGAVTFDKESVKRMFQEKRQFIHVNGNSPRDILVTDDYFGSKPLQVQYVGRKGGDNGSDTFCYCWYLYDIKTDKKMVFAYLKKEPYDDTIYTPTDILYDGVEAIRTNGEFNYVSALGAAGGYIPDADILKGPSTGSNNVGNYLLDLKDYQKIGVPFSATKIMTTLVALEYGESSDEVKYTATDVYYGSGQNNWEEGDSLSLFDALRVLLKSSDNSLAVAIARCVGEKILRNRDNY